MKISKRSFVGLAVISFVSIGLAGCSSEDTSSEKEVALVESELVETADAALAESAEPVVEKEESVIGKRSNPVPLNETIEFPVEYANEDWTETYTGMATMSISTVIRSEAALATLVSENQFNEPAPEGYEWMIFTVDMGLTEGDIDNPYTPMDMFTIIDAGGSEIPQDIYPSFDGNDFGYTAMFPDGKSTGRVAKIVKVGEDPLIVYSEGFTASYYFATH